MVMKGFRESRLVRARGEEFGVFPFRMFHRSFPVLEALR